MVQFAKLIRRIENHRLQKDEKLFFLCENVKMEDRDAAHFEPTFGVSYIVLDAQQLSPAKRRRSYFTNVSFRTFPFLFFFHCMDTCSLTASCPSCF